MNVQTKVEEVGHGDFAITKIKAISDNEQPLSDRQIEYLEEYFGAEAQERGMIVEFEPYRWDQK